MKRFASALAGLLVPAAMASAASVLTVTPVGLPWLPGTTGNIVDVIITGGATISATDILLFIGDGGPNVGGVDNPATSPRFYDSSTTVGTIFASNNTGNQHYTIGGGPEDMAAGNAQVTATFPAGVAGTGTLARFFVSTIGVPAGISTISVNLDNTKLNGGNEVYTALPSAITVIPEPASALLLIGALPFLRRRSA